MSSAEATIATAELTFDDFSLGDAWELGTQMHDAASESRLPLVIGVFLGRQRAFHAALPGSCADNDDWMLRKVRVALHYGRSSLAVGEDYRDSGRDFDTDSRLNPRRYSAFGGAVPIMLGRGGVLGAVGVSGLSESEDHTFVMDQLRAFQAKNVGRE